MTSSFRPDYLLSYAKMDAEEQERTRRANQPAEQMQQYVDKWKGEEAEKAGDDLLVLSKALDPEGPTGTLVADIIKGREKKIEQKADAELRERRMNNSLLPSEENKLIENEITEQELLEEDKASKQLSASVLAKTDDYHLAEMINSSSGYRKLYLAKKYLQLKSQNYGQEISESFRKDDREIPGPGGTSFRINDQDLHPTQKAAALQILNKEYVERHGLNGFDSMFLYDNFYKRKDGKGTDQQDSNFLTAYKKSRAINKSNDERVATFNETFESVNAGNDLDLNYLLAKLGTTVNAEGKGYTRAGLWQLLKTELTRRNKYDPESVSKFLEKLEKAPDPQWKGKTVGEKRGDLIAELKDENEAAYSAEITENARVLDAKGKAIELQTRQEAIQMIEDGQEITEEWIATKQKQYEALGLGKSDVISKIWTEQDEDSDAAIKRLEAESLNHPNFKVPSYLWEGYSLKTILKAKKAGLLLSKEETLKQNEWYKVGVSGIREDAKAALGLSGVEVRGDNAKFTLAVEQATNFYNSRVRYYINTVGLPEEQAHTNARNETKEMFRYDGKETGSAPVLTSPFFQEREVTKKDEIDQNTAATKDALQRAAAFDTDGTPLLNEEERAQYEKYKETKLTKDIPAIFWILHRVLKKPVDAIIKAYEDDSVELSEISDATVNDPSYSHVRQLHARGGGNPHEVAVNVQLQMEVA